MKKILSGILLTLTSLVAAHEGEEVEQHSFIDVILADPVILASIAGIVVGIILIYFLTKNKG